MNIEKHREIVIKNLPDNFTLSGKEILDMVNQLFEMVKLNNELINIMDKKIKILEAKAKK